jgi:hypothetical protein
LGDCKKLLIGMLEIWQEEAGRQAFCVMLNDMKHTSIRNSSTEKKLSYISNKIRIAETFLGIDTK